MKQQSLILFITGLLLIINFPMEVKSDFCPCGLNLKCNDGTSCTPCCGYGPCDGLCRHCQGGCRRGNGNRQTLEVPSFANGGDPFYIYK